MEVMRMDNNIPIKVMPEDIDVIHYKSSGKNILALVKDDIVIDSMKW
jgi:hypothetical protein